MDVSLSVAGSPFDVSRLLAQADAAAVAAALHHLTCDLTGAAASVLLQRGTCGPWRVHSAAGLASSSTGAWLDTGQASATAQQVSSSGEAAVVDDLVSHAPAGALPLDASVGVLLPVAADGCTRPLLLLAFDRGRPPDFGVAAGLTDAFGLALERQRLREALAAQHAIRDLLEGVSRAGGSPMTLDVALTPFCEGLVPLLAADVVEMWIHERRAHELFRVAASNGRGGARVDTGDRTSLLAASLRRDRAAFVPGQDGGAPTLVVPLRGRRRALGVLAAHGIRGDGVGDAVLIDRAEDIRVRLAALLENVQLLDDVLRSRRELENVFDSLEDAVVVTDGTGRIVEANRAFAARTGEAREALMDRPLDEHLSPGVVQWMAGAPRGARQAAAARGVQDERLRGTFDFTCTPLAGGDTAPGGQVLVARDVTEACRLEAERVLLEQRLMRSEKMLALGQFVAGVAHELNNPLQGVLGHLELIRASRTLPPRVKRDLGVVYREAGRAARIVRHLLLVAGSGRLRRRRLSVNAVVTRALRLRAQALRAAGIVVVRDLADELPRISGDGLLLQQAILNLVLNAEQAMRREGRLVVRTTRDRDGVRLVVEDSGPGLAADVAARLFEPFFTTKEVGKGSGLGLAIAYGIARAHGGTVEAGNHPAGGARFVIALPARAEA